MKVSEDVNISLQIFILSEINMIKICAVIVSYNPGDTIISNTEAIASQVDETIIVDNGSKIDYIDSLRKVFEPRRDIHIINNKTNLGIATALNIGMNYAIQLGSNWVITLDQDSYASPTLIQNLIQTLNRTKNINDVGFIGSNIKEQRFQHLEYRWLCLNKQIPIFFKRIKCNENDITDVTMIITSGALTNLKMFQNIGPFIDDFFIDYVDTEYCLRAKANGYKILVSAKAQLYHNLGDKKEVTFLGYTYRPTNHSSTRMYYIARNRIFMIKKYSFRFPHWLLFDSMASLYNAYRILLFENDRRNKIMMSVLGTIDGLLNIKNRKIL